MTQPTCNFALFRCYINDLDGVARMENTVVEFMRRAGRGLAMLAMCGLGQSAARAATVRVSTSLNNGGMPNGGSTTNRFSMSADGTHVAFTSLASNLVPGDTNNTGDVFVRNLQTGVTVRASVAAEGTQANSSSGSPSISADGTKVAFVSSADNLVPGNSSDRFDIFVKDLQTGAITRARVDSNGAEHERGISTSPRISADGTKVVFDSLGQLVPDDTNLHNNIYLRDLTTGAVTLVDRDANGQIFPFASGHPVSMPTAQQSPFAPMMPTILHMSSCAICKPVIRSKPVSLPTARNWQAIRTTPV
jgi:hypothetical protein